MKNCQYRISFDNVSDTPYISLDILFPLVVRNRLAYKSQISHTIKSSKSSAVRRIKRKKILVPQQLPRETVRGFLGDRL